MIIKHSTGAPDDFKIAVSVAADKVFKRRHEFKGIAQIAPVIDEALESAMSAEGFAADVIADIDHAGALQAGDAFTWQIKEPGAYETARVTVTAKQNADGTFYLGGE